MKGFVHERTNGRKFDLVSNQIRVILTSTVNDKPGWTLNNVKYLLYRLEVREM